VHSSGGVFGGHRLQQFGFRQHRLRLRHHLRGRVLAASNVIVEQRLDLATRSQNTHIGLSTIGVLLPAVKSLLRRLIPRP
jgi:hypothetical protein